MLPETGLMTRKVQLEHWITCFKQF